MQGISWGLRNSKNQNSMWTSSLNSQCRYVLVNGDKCPNNLKRRPQLLACVVWSIGKYRRTQADSCNAKTTSTHNSLQQNTFLVTKIAFQTYRSGTLWILQFCKPTENNLSGSCCYRFLLDHTCTDTSWATLGFPGRRLHQKEKDGQMDRWADGLSSPSWEKYKD